MSAGSTAAPTRRVQLLGVFASLVCDHHAGRDDQSTSAFLRMDGAIIQHGCLPLPDPVGMVMTTGHLSLIVKCEPIAWIAPSWALYRPRTGVRYTG